MSQRVSSVLLVAVVVVVAAMMVGFTSGELTDDCLACMCYTSSNCTMKTPVCQVHDWGTVCGPWAITEAYWMDGGEHNGEFYVCVPDWECNELTVRGYMDKYVPYPDATCEDYSKTHAGGPFGADEDYAIQYWYQVKDCLDYGLFTLPPVI